MNQPLPKPSSTVRKRWFVLGMLTALVLVSAALMSNRGPSYKGKTANQWFATLKPVRSPDEAVSTPAAEAFRHFGDTGAEFLFEKLTRRDSKIRNALVTVTGKLPWSSLHLEEPTTRHAKAMAGIAGMGESARALVPRLIDMLEGPDRYLAINLLAVIRTESHLVVPPLVRQMKNTELCSIERLAIATALSNHGAIRELREIADNLSEPAAPEAKQALETASLAQQR